MGSRWSRRYGEGSLTTATTSSYEDTERGGFSSPLYSETERLMGDGEDVRKSRRRKGVDFEGFVDRWLVVIERNAKWGALKLWRSTMLTKIKLLLTIVIFGVSLGLTIHIYHHTHFTPQPWRHHCALQPQFPPTSLPKSYSPFAKPYQREPQPFDFGTTKPVGVFVGIMSRDKDSERRQAIRNSWASHWVSRGRWNEGGIEAEGGWVNGTSRTVVRFIMGQPSDSLKWRVEEEMNQYHDIVVLPIKENMNEGKTFAFYDWAASNAWVPPPAGEPALTTPLVALAPHDPRDSKGEGWVRPDYVLKADDDAFIMLAELEARMRVLPRRLAYWGYPVRDKFRLFHAGEAYALSFDLVTYISESPFARSTTVGREDQVTSWWLLKHSRAMEIAWWHERCWIYDGPRAGTVYSRGFTFPIEVEGLKSSVGHANDGVVNRKKEWEWNTGLWGDPGRSTVARYTNRYSYDFASSWKELYSLPPAFDVSDNLDESDRREALIEGSATSLVGSTISASMAQRSKPKRMLDRYRHKETGGVPLGGTVLVHYLKKVEHWNDAEAILLKSWDLERA